MAYEPDNLQILARPFVQDAAQSYTIVSDVDDLATMTTAGYIDPSVASDSGIAGQLKLNDLFYVVATDGAALRRVSVVEPVTLVALTA